jgi:tetratricopeptide (TPR) repeat protein
MRIFRFLFVVVLALLVCAGAGAGEPSQGGAAGGASTSGSGSGEGGAATPSTGEAVTSGAAAAKTLFQSGQTAYGEARYADAAQLFQQAYDTWHHPAFLYNKGQSLIRIGRWQEALDGFQGYVAGFEGPDAPAGEQLDPLVYVQIAECLHRLNRRDEAAQAMRRYLDMSPQGALAPGVRQCIESGAAPSTIGERNPQTVEAARRVFDEAQDLVVRGQYREAAERFLEGYRQYNDIVEFLYDAAVAYRTGRLWADAVRTYQQYVQTPSPEPEAYIELAQCLHEQANYEQAVAAYRRYLELEPQGTFAQDAREYIQSMTSGGSGAPSQENMERASQHFERAAAHYAAGRYQEALQEFSQAYDLLPARAVQWNMAMCYLRLRDWTRALTAFENYLRGGDDGADAEAHLAAAECELELHQPDRARQHIEDYLRRADATELPNEEAQRHRAEQLMERVRQAAPGGGS